MIYVLFTKRKIKLIDNYNDMILIGLRLFIVFLIVEPCIFNSFKNSDNPSKSVSVISLNIVILLVLTILFMNKKMDKKHIFGVLIIFGGLYLLR